MCVCVCVCARACAVNANCDLKICDLGLARLSQSEDSLKTCYVVTRSTHTHARAHTHTHTHTHTKHTHTHTGTGPGAWSLSPAPVTARAIASLWLAIALTSPWFPPLAELPLEGRGLLERSPLGWFSELLRGLLARSPIDKLARQGASSAVPVPLMEEAPPRGGWRGAGGIGAGTLWYGLFVNKPSYVCE